MSAVFLSNHALWQTLAARIKSSRHVDAAIAYLGQGGARILPLRAGDRLVVDMSPPTVRAGATDPREIEKLIQRGINPFTRRHLHAKVVVGDNWTITGSANVSKHSLKTLDEAAIFSDDVAVVRRAREFVDRLCTEPIRSKYLKECKKIYRPPRWPVGIVAVTAKQRPHRVRPAKLWLVNLWERYIPDDELVRYESGERKAARLVKNTDRSTTNNFWYNKKPKMADELEVGDWIIQIQRPGNGDIRVYPPGQFLMLDAYPRSRQPGKKRYVFHMEVPRGGQSYTWSAFRRAAKSIVGGPLKLRMAAIRDPAVADGLLTLWTPAGYIARR